MKYLLAVCIVILVFSFNSFADIGYVSLEEAVRKSDLIIVGTLKNVTQPSGVAMEGGKAEIIFEQLIAGKVLTADGFSLEQGNKIPYKFTEIICNWGSHKRIENEKGVFTLTLNQNGEIASKNFRSLGELSEIKRFLKKGGKSKKTTKLIKIQNEIKKVHQNSVVETSFTKTPEISFGIYSLERKPNYRVISVLLVILVSFSLYYLLYRSRFKIR